MDPGLWSNGCFRSCFPGPESWGGVEGDEGSGLELMAVGAPGPHGVGWLGAHQRGPG